MGDEITTGQVRKALIDHFEVMLRNPSWDTIADILGDLIPGYEPGTTEYAEIEDYAYGLWGRGRIVFDRDNQ